MFEYWMYLSVLVAAVIMTMVVRFFMRHRSTIRKSILFHILYTLLIFTAVIAGREWLYLLLDHYKIHSVSKGWIDTFCSFLMVWVAVNEFFKLINRITRGHISKGNDATSARMVSRILKIAIVLIVILLFGEHLGIGFSGLLAFGGIGGIAIGVAGKDILGNIFSGVMLYFDRPFSIGDWISSPDRNIEGTVVEIGWRLTKIMTFDNRPIYVPNAVFSVIIVENPGRMENRRISTTLHLRHQDIDKVKDIVSDIREMLKDNRNIDQSQDLLIYFNEFGQESLDVMIYCFTKTTVWADWLAAQQDVYLKILDIVNQRGAALARHNQNIYMMGDVHETPTAA